MQETTEGQVVKEKIFHLTSDGLKESDGGRLRFLMELEFIQLLANPTYIHYLAQNRYFDDANFVRYLNYLQYWRRPEYAKFIMYPHSLFFLDLLQDAQFRTAMAHPANKEVAHRQQYYFWQHYRNNRLLSLDLEARKENDSVSSDSKKEDKDGVEEKVSEIKKEKNSDSKKPGDLVSGIKSELEPELRDSNKRQRQDS